jgi:hypothetical protein
VGGRIRLLLDNNLRYEDLEERVENAVLCVSPNKLSRVNVLDYFSNVPSIIYSLIPDEKTNFRRYSTRFASDSIRDLVSANIITGKNEDFKNIFGAMKNHNIAGALMGQIFESAILKFISHKLTAKLTARHTIDLRMLFCKFTARHTIRLAKENILIMKLFLQPIRAFYLSIFPDERCFLCPGNLFEFSSEYQYNYGGSSTLST